MPTLTSRVVPRGTQVVRGDPSLRVDELGDSLDSFCLLQVVGFSLVIRVDALGEPSVFHYAHGCTGVGPPTTKVNAPADATSSLHTGSDVHGAEDASELEDLGLLRLVIV